MFDTHLMIRANDGTLQEAPYALNSVSMNIADNPLLSRVVNPTVLSVGILNPPISWHFVCVDRLCIRRGVIMNKLVQRLLVSVRDNLQPNFSGSLDCSNSDSLVPFVSASHAAHLAANVSFVHFYNASQKLAVNLTHGRSDTVTEIPGCLISDVQGA